MKDYDTNHDGNFSAAEVAEIVEVRESILSLSLI
jgi:hypothetical protein